VVLQFILPKAAVLGAFIFLASGWKIYCVFTILNRLYLRPCACLRFRRRNIRSIIFSLSGIPPYSMPNP